MIPPPILITERLQLSPPVDADLEQLVFLLNESPDFSKNTLTMPYPYTKENGEFWIQLSENGLKNNDAVILAIRNRETAEIIGGIGLHITANHHKAEVGYWLGQSFWNQGYSTEALQCVLKYGFTQLNLHKIYASHFLYNPASGRIMEKCGMQKEAILVGEYFKEGKPLDIIRYSKFQQP